MGSADCSLLDTANFIFEGKTSGVNNTPATTAVFGGEGVERRRESTLINNTILLTVLAPGQDSL